MSTLISIDVEADGPCPGLYSMIELGAVVVEPGLSRTFRAQFRPLVGASFDEGALRSIGRTPDETAKYPDAREGIREFKLWLAQFNNPRAISDNPGFDWQFVNYYLHRFEGHNPLGFSCRRIGDIWSGLVGSFQEHTKWKSLRQTKHSHDALDDAMGNAEAILKIKSRLVQSSRKSW